MLTSGYHINSILSFTLILLLDVDLAVVIPGDDFNRVHIKPTETAGIKKKCKFTCSCQCHVHVV